MSARKSSAAKKRTKRRDPDPVRVYKDSRIAYWTGGKPGLGIRKIERTRPERTEARAAEIRSFLARATGVGRGADITLDQLVQDMVDKFKALGVPTGSIRQYKSNWNCWVSEDIGATRCIETGFHTWTQIFEQANIDGASEQTVRNIARTMGVVIEYGVEHGYFNIAEPFGEARDRRRVVKKARKRAAIIKAEAQSKIPLELCPTTEEVEKYALALEEVYPGFGRRAVEAAFASGMRLLEVLALKVDAINLETHEIDVDWQLDRSQHWPARKLPKGGKTRQTIYWSAYHHVFESLVEDATARTGDGNSWLFPPTDGQVAWADWVGHRATDAKLAADWDWTFHWLRHAWASLCLAPTDLGGYGLDPSSVKDWLGHVRLSTTTDMYVVRQKNDVAIARTRTERRPGEPAGRTRSGED